MITRQSLENIYTTYHHPKYLGLDPLACVHKFKGKGSAALEIVGMIASALAYGRVEIIVRSIDTLINNMMDSDPIAFTVNTSRKEKIKALKGFKHRFNDGDDVAGLLEGVKLTMREYGSLERCFCDPYDGDNPYDGRHQLRDALSLFTDTIRGYGDVDKYLLPDPRGGSACKRLLLFLRWMIRADDGIDLGAWKGAPPRILQIPVDTHVARIAKSYGLTARNQPDWKMSEEVTAALRAFDAGDPCRYDFAICHAGMVGARGPLNIS